VFEVHHQHRGVIRRQQPAPAPQYSIRMECRKRQDYGVHLTADILSPQDSILPALLANRKALAVTTSTVYKYYGRQLEQLIRQCDLDMSVHVLEGGESNKTIASVERICNEALAAKMDRKSVLVGIGGGVCTDVVAMAASAIRRGIDHMRVPTTLIGLVDAGIGLKGGVNLGSKKNYFGCFKPPSQALLDPAFLNTLPEACVRYGMAEILKMALVTDRELFRLCEAHQQALIESRFSDPWEIGREIIWRSTRSMLDELQKNPYEDQTYQRLVDMGHCFSPALEAATGYRMHHGEAVAIDMALTVTLAEALGMMDPSERNRFVDVLLQAGLPIHAPELTPALCEAALDEAEQHRGGAVHFPVPIEIGRCLFIEDRAKLPGRLIETALRRLAGEARDMHTNTH
jgi:3-dehydroquinate synthase